MAERIVVVTLEELERVVDQLLERRFAAIGASQATPSPLLSKQQLAAALGCSVAKVDRLTRAGKIPHVMLGDTRRFDLAAVRAALEHSEPENVRSPYAHDAPVRLLSRGGRGKM